MRIKNQKLLDSLRTVGPCRFCGQVVQRCAHHLWSKGAGRLDIRCNLIQLGIHTQTRCTCHTTHHQGNEPTHEQLLALNAVDLNCLQGDIETVVYLLRDQCDKWTTAEGIERRATKLNLSARGLLLRELEGFRHLLPG